GLDKRIGNKFLHAGPGYGGSCFPKDTLALLKTGQDEGAPLRIVETVVAVNDARKRLMARKIMQALGGSVRGKRVALLGLAFKPNTDDMRDAPSIAIVAALTGDGATVHAYDPESMEQARPLMPEGDLPRRRLWRGRGGGRAGDRHRMGRLPRARSRPGQDAD